MDNKDVLGRVAIAKLLCLSAESSGLNAMRNLASYGQMTSGPTFKVGERNPEYAQKDEQNFLTASAGFAESNAH